MRDGKPLLTDFGYRAVGNAGVESGSCRREGVFTNRAALRGPHVVDTIKRWRMPGWIYTHIASGEKRDQVTAARLKRMGVTPGFPELVFFGPHGEVCFIELKAERGRLSNRSSRSRATWKRAGTATTVPATTATWSRR